MLFTAEKFEKKDGSVDKKASLSKELIFVLVGRLDRLGILCHTLSRLLNCWEKKALAFAHSVMVPLTLGLLEELLKPKGLTMIGFTATILYFGKPIKQSF